MKKPCRALNLLWCLLVTAVSAQEAWYPYPVEVWNPPFAMSSPRINAEYVPLERAAKKWQVQVFFPHLKDDYWLAVNYGMADEARRLGIQLTLQHAGGYENLATQIAQIRVGLATNPDGIVIGAIAYEGLNELVAEIRGKGIPVIDVINGISSPEVSAKSLVSFGEMGYKAGEYLARKHPVGSQVVKVAWFPGPQDAGWVQAGDLGFHTAVKAGAIEVVATLFGDTGKEAQSRLIEQALIAHADIDYIVGTAVTAEAAPALLRQRRIQDRVKVLGYYFTPDVYRGIRRGQILAAPTDSPVIQGRIAIDQVVRILEKQPYLKHVGPALRVIDASNIQTFDRSATLAPDGFRPVLSVN